MTGQEILEIIKEKLSIDAFANQEYSPKDLGLGKVKVVDEYGGADQGSTWYVVQYFEDHDVYIRTDGWYSSYEGVFFDEGHGYVVRPTQRMVTFYE